MPEQRENCKVRRPAKAEKPAAGFDDRAHFAMLDKVVSIAERHPLGAAAVVLGLAIIAPGLVGRFTPRPRRRGRKVKALPPPRKARRARA